MKIRRMITTISTSIDELINRVENHQAVADCAIDEVRRAAGKIRVQLNSAQARRQHHQRDYDRISAQRQLWRERALGCRESAPDKALRCMQSVQMCAKQLEDLQQQMDESTELCLELQRHLTAVEQQLGDLQRKRAALNARSARNNAAAHSLHLADSSPAQVFDRWEESLLAKEYEQLPLIAATDGFEQEFIDEETQRQLKAELAALTAEHSSSPDISPKRS